MTVWAGILLVAVGLTLIANRGRPHEAMGAAAARPVIDGDPGPGRSMTHPRGDGSGMLRRRARMAGVLLGGVAGLLIGPLAGLALGSVAVVALTHLVARHGTQADTDRRTAITLQAPLAAELIASCLAAGATPAAALRAVAPAIADPTGALLAAAGRESELGGSMAQVAVWLRDPVGPSADADMGSDALDLLARGLERSARTGAPLADLLLDEASAMRRSWLDTARAHAKAQSVRAVLPLALCHLPAFLALGVVPVVAGLVDTGW